jgi:ATP-dependent Lon protease
MCVGETMPLESVATPGNGNLKLTSSFTIKESAQLTLSWFRGVGTREMFPSRVQGNTELSIL